MAIQMDMLTAAEVKNLFRQDSVVSHYESAAVEIGLWRSEEVIFRRVFSVEQTVLELGCGCGRIALGMWELGYRRILATDFSKEMITAARRLAKKLGYAVPLRVADATCLGFEDGMFDGVIFGFNGLMQIPGVDGRERALREMRRVIRPGGRAVFTTHDRLSGNSDGFWAEERARWDSGLQDPRLVEFGDRLVGESHGQVYIHIPTRDEVLRSLRETGWELVDDAMRSEITTESPTVHSFSADCRFWIVQRPLGEGERRGEEA